MKALDVISIPVSDQQKAKDFYLKLGLTLIVEAPFEGGNNWIQLGFPEGGTSVTLVTWFDHMKPGSLDGMVINTDNIDQDIQQLSERGIAVSEVQDTPWGKFATIKDPDGNSWSLNQKSSEQ